MHGITNKDTNGPLIEGVKFVIQGLCVDESQALV
jgi:hypothetical protein